MKGPLALALAALATRANGDGWLRPPASPPAAVVELRQVDFDGGSYIASQAGATYKLMEDVVFRPLDELNASQPELWMFPDMSQPPYNASPFRLGFFAALIVAANGVTVDLNGKRLSQSFEHAMAQRFFALIELSNSPFPANKGPAAFSDGAGYVASAGVTIKNGFLGPSSHHGVHGNDNVGVVLQNLDISGFEVSGIALNQVDNLVVDQVKVRGGSTKVPANGRLSASIFMLQAVSKWLRLDERVGAGAPAMALLDKMAEMRTEVFNYLQSGASRSADVAGIFESSVGGIPDASMINGIQIHAAAAMVGDFQTVQPANPSKGIVLNSVTVSDLAVNPVEIGALSLLGKNMMDPVGTVLQIDFSSDPETGKFVPNALANLQLAFADYALQCAAAGAAGCSSWADPAQKGLMSRSTITRDVINWAYNGGTLDELWAKGYTVTGNHDIMFHLNKGALGIKLDGTANVIARNVVVSNIANVATPASRSRLAVQRNPGYQYTGYAARGVSVASSVNVDLGRIAITGVSSAMTYSTPVHSIYDCDGVSAQVVKTLGNSSRPLPPGGRGL